MTTSSASSRFRRPTLGLFVSEREVVLAHAGRFATAPAVVGRVAYSGEPAEAGRAIEGLLAPFRPRFREGRRPVVVVGVPDLSLLQALRPRSEKDREASPEMELQKSLLSQEIRAGDLVADRLAVEVGGQALASLVACRKQSVARLAEAVGRQRARLVRMEPAPCALLRSARRAVPARGAAGPVARVILGRDEALAVLEHRGATLGWSRCELGPDRSLAPVLTSLSDLRLKLRLAQVTRPIGRIVVHGEAPHDAGADSGIEALGRREGCEVSHAPGPELSAESVAMGLALASQRDAWICDLARRHEPPLQYLELVSWRELVVQAGLIAGATAYLLYESQSAGQEVLRARSEQAEHPGMADRTEADLEAAKGAAEARDRAVSLFWNGRVAWAPHLVEVSSHLPEGARLESFQGAADLEASGSATAAGPGGRSPKSLALKVATPVNKDGKIPEAIDAYVTRMRGDRGLSRDFEQVELTDLRSSLAASSKGSIASFHVVCRAKAAPAAGPLASAAPK